MQAPPSPPVVVQVPQPPVIRTGSPGAIYEAYRNQRRELANQLERLEDQRDNISRELRNVPGPMGADRAGLEQRLGTVDQRVASLEQQIADADAQVARAAAVPGAVVQPPPRPPDFPPEEFWVLSGVFMFIVVLPLTIAYARRIWRRGAAAVASIPQEIYDRFSRLDQSVDAIAIEVERIGEGQRFLTRMQADQQRALGAGPAERVEIADREREHQRKGP